MSVGCAKAGVGEAEPGIFPGDEMAGGGALQATKTTAIAPASKSTLTLALTGHAIV